MSKFMTWRPLGSRSLGLARSLTGRLTRSRGRSNPRSGTLLLRLLLGGLHGLRRELLDQLPHLRRRRGIRVELHVRLVRRDRGGRIAGRLGGLRELELCCLLYTSDAADEEDSVDLGGRRIIKKK